jgi:hypothetical protein
LVKVGVNPEGVEKQVKDEESGLIMSDQRVIMARFARLQLKIGSSSHASDLHSMRIGNPPLVRLPQPGF